MKAPFDDSEMSRAIRAHEMMHAKVSPGAEMGVWFARGIASEEALRACEELRVNLLCQKAGFDMKNHLSDGGETEDGERIAATNDWASAVFMAVACAGTASSKKYLTGIRRNNRLWGKALRKVTVRAEREMNKAYQTGSLASTSVTDSGLAPRGMVHTERLAEWVDRLAAQEPPKPPETKEETGGETGGEGEPENSGNPIHSNEGPSASQTFEEFDEQLKTVTPDDYRGSAVPEWDELVVGRPSLNVHAPGSIGKKRIASNSGRHPRRLHRLLTDPQRRIFDRTIHGKGGVIVIDCSGSMSLSVAEIKTILKSAPGATVLAYSTVSAVDGSESAWILAHKGKMVTTLPEMGGGNGVDHPALEWGIKARQRPTSPVVWITDGGVCGKNFSFTNVLAMQCIKTCQKNNVLVYPHVEEAVEALQKLSRGERPLTHWPRQLRSVWREMMGTRLLATTK
jgi:hypothetical protein